MKISASIYSNKGARLEDLVRELDQSGVDFFHVDCKDDISVFDDIERIRTISEIPIDLHLITSRPEAFFGQIHKHKIEFVTLQYEELKGEIRVPDEIESRLGLAITSSTNIDVFESFMDRFSFVLFMATTPGESGGVFRRENFKKIRKFNNRYPKVRIHVDGGVNEEVSFILRNLGVDSIVSGSFLFRNGSVSDAMSSLKRIQPHYFVKDFMIGMSETPVLEADSGSVMDALKLIDDYRLGITTVVDSLGCIKGIITNADVRKALIRKSPNVLDLSIEDVLNTKPVFVYEDQTVTEMIELVKAQSFPILYLPVVNRKHKVKGTVIFYNMIKGEL